MTLKEYLTRQQITEGAFAERIGCSREAVRRYCAGERIPEAKTMRAIALQTGCNVTANDFFGIEAAAA